MNATSMKEVKKFAPLSFSKQSGAMYYLNSGFLMAD